MVAKRWGGTFGGQSPVEHRANYICTTTAKDIVVTKRPNPREFCAPKRSLPKLILNPTGPALALAAGNSLHDAQLGQIAKIENMTTAHPGFRHNVRALFFTYDTLPRPAEFSVEQSQKTQVSTSA